MASRAHIRAFAMGAAVSSAVLVAAGFAAVRTAERRSAVEPELATYMGELQHHTHKLNLSILSENAALAGFYLHEVGEITEQIEQLFPDHDGFPVADLARATLDPQLVALRGAIDRASWEEARSGLSELVASCNACHAAAGHGFIEVEVTDANPFNQSFAK